MKGSEQHSIFRKASSEETSPEELSEIAKTDDILILSAVAANKSSSEKTIESLRSTGFPEVLDCLRKRGVL